MAANADPWVEELFLTNEGDNVLEWECAPTAGGAARRDFVPPGATGIIEGSGRVDCIVATDPPSHVTHLVATRITGGARDRWHGFVMSTLNQ